jgi:CHAT domain-containing protein
MARALHQLGDDEEALAALRESVELIEARQALVPMTPIVAVHYFHDKAAPYLQYADLLAELGRPREALEVLERAHGRALLDLLRSSKDEPSRTATERERERQLQMEIVTRNQNVVTATAAGRRAARKALETARLELERFEATLAIEHSEAVPRARPAATASADRPRIPRGMAVVEYGVFADHVRIFVATRANDGTLAVRSRRAPIAYDELRPLVERLAHRIDARAFDYAADARRLYRLLIAPIEPLIASRRELCIVPDGILWLVPFPMLEDGTGDPLLRRATILVAPSIAIVDAAPPRTSGVPLRSVLAFGAGKGIAGGAPDLPDADDEAATIAALYPRHELLTNGRATEAAAKRDAARYDVLHFATHAVAQIESPMYSALLLAAGDGNDGRLEAWEVARLKLHASVAVLSACDTGSGSVYNGEGIVGLSWAFLLAGCRTTIVSQWRVRSDAAAALMTDFHRRLRGGRSPAAALREAALALRSRPAYRHPADWAAFIAVGAP